MKIENIKYYKFNNSINSTKVSVPNLLCDTKYNSNALVYPLSFGISVMPSVIPFYDRMPENTITDILQGSTIFNDFLLFPTQNDAAENIINSNNEFINQHFYGEEKELNRFGVAVLQYKNMGQKAYSNLLDNLNRHNIRNAAKQYEELYVSTIKPMEDVAKGEVQYSDFWVKEKTLGNKNLADLLLESLHYNKSKISTMPSSQKANIINTALQRQGKLKSFYNVIVTQWLNNIFNQEEVSKPNNLKSKQPNNYDSLKTLFHGLKRNDENAFIEFLKSDDIDNMKLGDKNIIDIMVEAVQDEGENYLDKNTAFKKKALLAFAEFPDMRTNAINAVLKQIVKAELKSEAEAEVINIPDNIKTSKLNPALVQQLYSSKSQHDASEIINRLKHFADDYKQSFRCLIPQNPLMVNSNNFGNNDEKYSLIFSLLKDALNTAPDDTAKKILESLNQFSSAYKKIENNIQPNINTERLWRDITKIASSHWENKYLPQLLNTRLQAILDIAQYKKNSYQIEDETIYSIQEILKSNDYTPEQQAFLLKRSIQDGYDFRRFVSQDKPNSYLRKEFINSLMQKENDLKNDFKLFQEEFINSVRIKDIDHYMNLQTPDGNFLNIIGKNLNLNFSSLSELSQRLNELSDDELNLLTAKTKSVYCEMKRKSDFVTETNKYDFALELDRQLTQKADSININIDGNAIKLKDAMTSQYDNITNKLGLIDENLADTKVAVDKVLDGIIDIKASLKENLERIEKIEATLTVLEKRFPEKSKDVREAKTWLGKLKQRLKQSFTPKGLLKWGLGAAGATAAMVLAGPAIAAGAASIGLTGGAATALCVAGNLTVARLGGMAASSIV